MASWTSGLPPEAAPGSRKGGPKMALPKLTQKKALPLMA